MPIADPIMGPIMGPISGPVTGLAGRALAAALLLSPLGPAVAAPQTPPPGAKTCLDTRFIDGHRAIDAHSIEFRVGSHYYRNHLRSACPDVMRLNSFASLATESQGSQLCAGDSVRIFDADDARAVGLRAYPRCELGWFEPIPPPPKGKTH